jgi:hypothetical protein
MKILGNLFVASLLAVATGVVVFFATRGETVEVESNGTATAGYDEHGKSKTRVYESDGDRPEPSQDGPHPKLVCDDVRFEFGRMELGTERSHTFEIHNKGEADLVMKTGTPTCKCTQFELEKSVLKPGESGKIFLTWKPVSESPDFSQRAPIYTNDPDLHPDPFWIEIEGFVTSVVTTQPEQVWSVGVIADGEPTRFEGLVFSRLFEEFKIADMTCSDPKVAFSMSPMDEEQLKQEDAKCGYVVALEVPSDVAVGKYRHELSFRVETDEDDEAHEREDYKLGIKGHKYGPIEFLPTFGVHYEKSNSYVDMGEFSAEEGKEIKMLVFVSSDEGDPAFEVTDIEVNPSFVDVKMVEDTKYRVKNRKRYELKLNVPAGSPRGAREAVHAAKIVIRTNHPRAREVQFRMGFVAL